MNAIDRFLRYVTYDTQSDEGSGTCPSTEKMGAATLRSPTARPLPATALRGKQKASALFT